MRTTTKAVHGELSEESRVMVEEKLLPLGRLLGEDEEAALLEIKIERSPAEGRSSEPYRIAANLTVNGRVFHAEAVKPTAESAADKVREELTHAVQHLRGEKRHFLKRGGAAVKSFLRGFSE